MKALVLFALFASAALAVDGQGVTLIGRTVPELMIEKWDLPEDAPRPRMGELKGKVVAILLFQAACHSCHETGFPLFQDIEKELGADPDLVTLYIQTPFEMFFLNGFAQGQATVKKFEVKGKFGQDRNVSGTKLPMTFQRFRADGTPWVVFVDRAGVVRFAGYPELRRGMLDKLKALLAQKEPSK